MSKVVATITLGNEISYPVGFMFFQQNFITRAPLVWRGPTGGFGEVSLIIF